MYFYTQDQRYLARGKFLILGDSITDAGRYLAFFQTYLRLFNAADGLEVINLGVASETCSGLSEPEHPFVRPCVHQRIDAVLQEVQPDFTLICYGVNDMIYHPYTEDRMYAFKRGLVALIEKVRATGSKVFVATPCVFDAKSFRGRLLPADSAESFSYKTPFAEYDDVLEKLAQWERTQLTGYADAVIDWHTATRNELAERRREQPEFVSGDGIHPAEPLACCMARTLLFRLCNVVLPRFWQLLQGPGMALYQKVLAREQLAHNFIKEKVGHTNPNTAPALPADRILGALAEADAEISAYIAATPSLFDGFTCDHYGFKRKVFWALGHEASVVVPKTPLPGNPWVWKTEFLGAFPDAELALLAAGYHVVYLNLSNQFGLPATVEKMEQFYHIVTQKFALAPKMLLMGLSRGGLYATRFAARYPQWVSGLYLDAPVISHLCWPMAIASVADNDYRLCSILFKNSTTDPKTDLQQTLSALAQAKLPTLLVYGMQDYVVPFAQSGALLQAALQAVDAPLTVIAKPQDGHHPHGLTDQTPVLEFALGLL